MAKRYMEEVWARGWASVDAVVCAECLTEPALAEVASENGKTGDCDYCDGPGPSAPVDFVLAALVEGLRAEYGDPDNEGVAYDSSEGGYQMPVYDTWDLLYEFEVTENEKLHVSLARAVEQLWCQRNPYEPEPHQVLAWGWDGFREHVKHRSRYLFVLPATDDDKYRGAGEIAPGEMLKAILAAIDDAGLAKVLPAGTTSYRARVHAAGEHPMSATDIGSPPVKAAKTNRMSAAGISAFYGASTAEGALAEVRGYAAPDDHATVGHFITARDMPVIDLVDLPDVPSLFDAKRRHLRPAIRFLRGFAEDVARVAHPDEKQHLEYVPTQVVAEYLRYIFPHHAGVVMGVLWRSSKDPGVTDCVLFVSNDGCVEQVPGWDSNPDVWLALVPGSPILHSAPL